MENLKRYGPSVNKMGFGTMQRLDNGGWVKFSEVKELLQTAHNKPSTKSCATCIHESLFCDACIKCCHAYNSNWEPRKTSCVG